MKITYALTALVFHRRFVFRSRQNYRTSSRDAKIERTGGARSQRPIWSGSLAAQFRHLQIAANSVAVCSAWQRELFQLRLTAFCESGTYGRRRHHSSTDNTTY
jgi:hypothetical protein